MRARIYVCTKSRLKKSLVGLFAALRSCGKASSSCRVLGVTKVGEGTAAIERAKHELLNAAVLISTGKEMDLAETVLNLRDVNPGVEIIIIADSQHAEERDTQAAAIVRALPGTTLLRINELERYLAAPAWR